MTMKREAHSCACGSVHKRNYIDTTIQGLSGIEECSRPDIEEEILHITTRLHIAECKVKLAWVLAHIGIKGNEDADKEANKGRKLQSKIEVGLAGTEVNSIINDV